MMERHSTTTDDLSPETELRLREIMATQHPSEAGETREFQKGTIYLGTFCHLAGGAVIWAIYQWILVLSKLPYMVPDWVEEEIQARRAAKLTPVLRDLYLTLGIYVLLKCFHLFLRRETRPSGLVLRKVWAVVVIGWFIAVAFSAPRLASDLNPVPLLWCAIAAIVLKGVFNLIKLSI